MTWLLAQETVDMVWRRESAIPVLLVFLIALAAVTGAIGLYLREGRRWPGARLAGLASLRTTVIVVLCWMLLGWTVQPHRLQRADLVVLLDNSLSMERVDAVREQEAFQQYWRRAELEPLGDPSRWNLARAVFVKLPLAVRERILEQYRLQVVTLDGTRWTAQRDSATWNRFWESLQASLPESPLGASLRHLADGQRGRSTAALVFLTDGAETGRPELEAAAEHLRRHKIPLFIVSVGDQSAERDLAVERATAPRRVWLGDYCSIDVDLAWRGLSGARAELTLSESDTGRIAQRQQVELQPDTSEADSGADGERSSGQAFRRFRIGFRPDREGPWRLAVEATVPGANDPLENNRQIVEIEVINQTTRVLLAASKPTYEYRYLANLLRRNSAADGRASPFQVTAVLQDADPPAGEDSDDPLRPSPLFPVGMDQLLPLDVFVLGDVDPARLPSSALEHIRDLVVDHGKGLLLIAGPDYMPNAYRHSPLAELFPFHGQPVTAQSRVGSEPAWNWALTPLGAAQGHLTLADTADAPHTIWRGLPGFYWLQTTPDLRPGVMTWARAEEDIGIEVPLIVARYAGKGRVIWHATDELWRWRLGREDATYDRYWLQTLHFLHASSWTDDPTSDLWTTRAVYPEYEPVMLLAQTSSLDGESETDLHVEVFQGEAIVKDMPLEPVVEIPGRYRCQVDDLPSGEYQARLVGGSTSTRPSMCTFEVRSADPESHQPAAQVEQLDMLARHTGGRCFRFSQVNDLWEVLPAGRSAVSAALPPRGVWNSWPVALGLLGLLCAEWYLRWRWGWL